MVVRKCLFPLLRFICGFMFNYNLHKKSWTVSIRGGTRRWHFELWWRLGDLHFAKLRPTNTQRCILIGSRPAVICWLQMVSRSALFAFNPQAQYWFTRNGLGTIHLRRQHVLGGEGCHPRPIERRLDWVFYKTEMKIWAVWAVRAVRKKKWIWKFWATFEGGFFNQQGYIPEMFESFWCFKSSSNSVITLWIQWIHQLEY